MSRRISMTLLPLSEINFYLQSAIKWANDSNNMFLATGPVIPMMHHESSHELRFMPVIFVSCSLWILPRLTWPLDRRVHRSHSPQCPTLRFWLSA